MRLLSVLQRLKLRCDEALSNADFKCIESHLYTAAAATSSNEPPARGTQWVAVDKETEKTDRMERERKGARVGPDKQFPPRLPHDSPTTPPLTQETGV